ncbi:MAG: nicotinate (nicotinamide) nucleotide adenylyltransferase [Phycisphaeraceae bacterium]|nr:nicotinate (nicotinamide) nucleotide adenylyltransferase [Phycisphaeraceae bacterium]
MSHQNEQPETALGIETSAGEPAVVVYGGTFDPPHLAHVRQAARVRKAIGAETVVYVPAGQSPLKANRPLTATEDRMAMLRIALREQSWATICRYELDRITQRPDEPTYTIDTLEHFNTDQALRGRLRLLIGADQLAVFDQWRNWRRIDRLAPVVVMLRPPWTGESLLAKLPEALRTIDWSRRMVPVPLEPHRSTEIRRLIAAGESTEELLDPRVREWIDQRGLYQ